PTRPVAVLDWDMGTRGDPLFDLATLLSYWSEAGDPEDMRLIRQMPSTEPGFLTRREAAALYAELTGIDLSDFLFVRVLGLYKLGAVFLQLYARHCRGTVSDPRYEQLGEIGESIFEFTLEVAEERRF
ncbi:MAG: phosphotransferase, partial [Alphaproteobacteria bacterium]